MFFLCLRRSSTSSSCDWASPCSRCYPPITKGQPPKERMSTANGRMFPNSSPFFLSFTAQVKWRRRKKTKLHQFNLLSLNKSLMMDRKRQQYCRVSTLRQRPFCNSQSSCQRDAAESEKQTFTKLASQSALWVCVRSLRECVLSIGWFPSMKQGAPFNAPYVSFFPRMSSPTDFVHLVPRDEQAKSSLTKTR